MPRVVTCTSHPSIMSIRTAVRHPINLRAEIEIRRRSARTHAQGTQGKKTYKCQAYVQSLIPLQRSRTMQVSKCRSALGCCVNLNLFTESTLVSRPYCRVSFVGRYVVELSGPPTVSPRTGPRKPWVSCLDPRGSHRVQDDPVTKSQPLCVGWSRDVLLSVRTYSVSCLTLMCN